MVKDFVSLVYPSLCAGCARFLHKQETCICTFCRYHIPRTGYHLFKDNPVMNLFRGRVEIASAAAFLEFAKSSRVQRLIHTLKYEGKKEVGLEMGRMYGTELASSILFNNADVIV